MTFFLVLAAVYFTGAFTMAMMTDMLGPYYRKGSKLDWVLIIVFGPVVLLLLSPILLVIAGWEKIRGKK